MGAPRNKKNYDIGFFKNISIFIENDLDKYLEKDEVVVTTNTWMFNEILALS